MAQTGVRIEDKIENLKIHGLAFGDDVKQKYQICRRWRRPRLCE